VIRTSFTKQQQFGSGTAALERGDKVCMRARSWSLWLRGTTGTVIEEKDGCVCVHFDSSAPSEHSWFLPEELIAL